MREVMSVILRIPPEDPSSLRASFLLRLTGEALSSIPGYPAEPDDIPQIMDWLDDLDQAWLCVLRSQVWEPPEQGGSEIPADREPSTGASSMSQTDRTRLRSLLVAGKAELEDWWAEMAGDEASIEERFGRLQVQERPEIFFETLPELAELEGTGMLQDDDIDH
jgi:hypothetical protein